MLVFYLFCLLPIISDLLYWCLWVVLVDWRDLLNRCLWVLILLLSFLRDEFTPTVAAITTTLPSPINTKTTAILAWGVFIVSNIQAMLCLTSVWRRVWQQCRQRVIMPPAVEANHRTNIVSRQHSIRATTTTMTLTTTTRPTFSPLNHRPQLYLAACTRVRQHCSMTTPWCTIRWLPMLMRTQLSHHSTTLPIPHSNYE